MVRVVLAQLTLLHTVSWPSWRHRPIRPLLALCAIACGVALGLAVHLINQSALGEFDKSLRTTDGVADLTLNSHRGLPSELVATLRQHPGVAQVAPFVRRHAWLEQGGRSEPVRLLGVDALALAQIQGQAVLQPAQSPLDAFAADAVFANAEARQRLASPTAAVSLRIGPRTTTWRLAGQWQGAPGPQVAVDIAALQQVLGTTQVDTIEVRLAPGATRESVLQDLKLPSGAWVDAPTLQRERQQSASRAYRVNLTALALVALFTGSFLVFSVLWLGVAQRLQTFALLGVLGLSAKQRMQWVLAEATVLGMLGSALGVALGTWLAALALQLVGADLGGGYFSSRPMQLVWQPTAALAYAALGLAATLLGAWWPAQRVQQLALSQTLKGLHTHVGQAPTPWGLAWLSLGAVLCLLPAWQGVPWGAYLGIALILLGGIFAIPWLLHHSLRVLGRHRPRTAMTLCLWQRAKHLPHEGALATSGVVASLALATALSVMVGSFRQSVSDWLDVVLPADMYVRSAALADGSTPPLSPEVWQALTALPGVQRIRPSTSFKLTLDQRRVPITVLARPLSGQGQYPDDLPLLQSRPVPPQSVAVWISESARDAYDLTLGQQWRALQNVWPSAPPLVVAGVWRDYARQHGSVLIDWHDLPRLGEPAQATEAALWLGPQARVSGALQAWRNTAAQRGWQDTLEVVGTQDLRARSMQIFDRSFAITRWLQVVAVAIGLFGVAATYSAHLLARGIEMGLLTHLGVTRAQQWRLLMAESALWSALGVCGGLVLGLAISLVLVYGVNPQSFHWSMDLHVPWLTLTGLAAGVLGSCMLTCAWCAKQLRQQHATHLVKQAW
jgi:putative ABC transport system permease protein